MPEPTLSAVHAPGGMAPSPTVPVSAISWGAIVAGAAVASAATLILLALGSGIGFASISPWPNTGMSGLSFAVATAIWLIVTQWVSASLGGYIAGRLRSRWIGTHAHEVFFRDTAHGLITWAVASLVMTVTLSSAVVSSLGSAGHAAGEMAARGLKEGAAASTASGSYDVDRLLRPSSVSATSSGAADPKPEVAHIIANATTSGGVAEGDRAYLTQLVAARAGVSQEDAQKRVDELVAGVLDTQAKAKAAADAARKAAADASLYLALSLLVGAFIASVSAVLGGHLRDAHP